MEDFELDGDVLKQVAGGGCYMESTKPSPKIKDIMKDSGLLLMFQ